MTPPRTTDTLRRLGETVLVPGGIVVAIAMAVVCMVCSAPQARVESSRLANGIRPLSVKLIRAPRGVVFDQPAFLRSIGKVVFVRYPSGTRAASLDTVDLRKRTPRLLALPATRGCRSVSRTTPVALPDSKLGYLATCLGNPARLPYHAVTLHEYDPRTARSTRLLPYYLPLRSGLYTFGRGMKRGLIDGGDGLRRIGRHRLVPARTGVPAAAYPAWSPNGNSLALVSGVRDGPYLGPQAIYVVDRKSGKKRRLVSGLKSCGPVAWSPNGRWLVGSIEPKGASAGLWLIDSASGKLALVLKSDDFGSATWLPDGRTIVVGVGIYSNIPGTNISPGAPVGLDVVRLPRLG
jgi:hypothetical protein